MTTLTTVADVTPTLTSGVIIQVENELMEVRSQSGTKAIEVTRGVAGTVAAAHAAGQGVSNMNSPITAELESLAAEFECLAIADAPDGTVGQSVEWADAGNVRPTVMGIDNWVNTFAPGSFWLNAVMRRAAEDGYQRGIDGAPVIGVERLSRSLSHSPRAATATDVSRLVGAYLSVIALNRGQAQIVGDTFKGVDNATRIWSIAAVARRVITTAEIAAEAWQSRAASEDNLEDQAYSVEKSLSLLINNGEIAYAIVTTHPTKNTQAAREAGRSQLFARVGVWHPIKQTIIDLELPIA